MKRFAHAPLYGSALLAVFAACTSGDTANDTAATTTAEVSSALQSAQCDFQSFKATADACFATFDTCKAATGANVDDCRTALRTCLPPAPEGRGPHGPHGKGGGEGRPPHDPNDTDDIGDTHGAPPDGGPPPGARGGEDHRGGKGGHGGRGGHPAPDAAAIEACHNTLSECLAVPNADQTVCFTAEDACVRDAFRKPFKEACDTATPACTDDAGATSTDCGHVARCCRDGVDGPPDVDGGAQCQ